MLHLSKDFSLPCWNLRSMTSLREGLNWLLGLRYAQTAESFFCSIPWCHPVNGPYAVVHIIVNMQVILWSVLLWFNSWNIVKPQRNYICVGDEQNRGLQPDQARAKAACWNLQETLCGMACYWILTRTWIPEMLQIVKMTKRVANALLLPCFWCRLIFETLEFHLFFKIK